MDGATDWHSVCKDWALTGKRAKALWERGTGTPRDSLARYWWGHVPNTLNGVTPMLPFYLFVARPSGRRSVGNKPTGRERNPGRRIAIRGRAIPTD